MKFGFKQKSENKKFIRNIFVRDVEYNNFAYQQNAYMPYVTYLEK